METPLKLEAALALTLLSLQGRRKELVAQWLESRYERGTSRNVGLDGRKQKKKMLFESSK